uniref:Ig-like domain-containing protein n=1 Tax=Macrostomum lignano TaxID=282301 RepID=A0A1I8IYP7_9PLAT
MSFDLISYFSVPVSLSYQNGTLFCSLECNSQTITTVSAQIPEIKEPCITRFLLPPDSNWIDGATVNLTADSSQGNWLATSHSCFLQSEGVPNSTLRIVSSTNSSSTFSVTVSRRWGSSASVACLVNQSGLIETWARHPLPAALYPVRSASIRLAAPQIRANSSAQILLLASNRGNPPSLHSCSASGRNLTQIMPLVMKEGEPVSVSVRSVGGNPEPSHWCWLRTAQGGNLNMSSTDGTQSDQTGSIAMSTNFSANSTRRMDGAAFAVPDPISSASIRIPSGGIRSGSNVKVELLASDRGNPPAQHFCQLDGRSLSKRKDPPNNSWTATQPLVMKEGEPVSVSVRSVGGNPEPSHRCWLRTAQGGNISMSSTDGTQSDQTGSIAKSTNFSANSTRRMDGGSVACSVSQTGLEDLSSNFLQNITVFYRNRNLSVHLSSRRIRNGSAVRVTLLASGQGNPPGRHSCRVAQRGLTQIQRPVESNASSVWTIDVLTSDNGNNISCKVEQAASNGSIIFKQWMDGGSVACSVSQTGLEDLSSSNFRQNITVFYEPYVNLSDPSFNGTSFSAMLNISDGNPSPEAQCFANGAQLNSSDTALALQTGQASHSLTHLLEAHNDEINISCVISQHGKVNFSKTHYWILNSTDDAPTKLPIIRGNGNKNLLFLLPVLLLLLLLLVAVPVLLRRRRGVTLGEPSGKQVNDSYRHTSLELEQDFMRSHYLY